MKMASEAKLSLKSGSEYLYDGLIVLAPKVSGIGVDVTVDNIMEFVDNGGNLFVAAAPVYSSFIEKVNEVCGKEQETKGPAPTGEKGRRSAVQPIKPTT